MTLNQRIHAAARFVQGDQGGADDVEVYFAKRWLAKAAG